MIINQVAYLRTSRSFPEDDIHTLCLECNRSYVDIANAVNIRVIGLFTTHKSSITGESWYFNSQKRQSLRQIYVIPPTVTSGSTINIGFKLSKIYQISPKSCGSYTDASGNWYGIQYSTDVVLSGRITFYVTVNPASTISDQIVVQISGSAPVLVTGTIDLEWIADV